MHPITQSILAIGVLALVGMGGYVIAYGLPVQETKLTSVERLKEKIDQADEHLCRFNLSREWGELSDKGRADRVRCLAQD